MSSISARSLDGAGKAMYCGRGDENMLVLYLWCGGAGTGVMGAAGPTSMCEGIELAKLVWALTC
jgi:hypothetical protein